jgi:hypothetical protein
MKTSTTRRVFIQTAGNTVLGYALLAGAEDPALAQSPYFIERFNGTSTPLVVTSGQAIIADGLLRVNDPVFRCHTPGSFPLPVAVDMTLRVEGYLGQPAERPDYTGVHHLVNYVNQFQLHSASIRGGAPQLTDSGCILKRKYPVSDGGKYVSLSQIVSPALPVGRWFRLRTEARRVQRGVEVTLRLDGKIVAQAIDTGYDGSKWVGQLTGGAVALRCDWTLVECDHIVVCPLGGDPGFYNFESGSLGGWEVQAGGGIQRFYSTTARAFNGRASAAFDVNTTSQASTKHVVYVRNPEVRPGQTLDLYAAITPGLKLARLTLFVQQPAEAGWAWLSRGYSPSELRADGGWNRLRLTLPEASVAPYHRMGLLAETSGATSGTIWFDSVQW